MSIQEEQAAGNDQEKSEAEVLKERIKSLRDQIVIAHLSPGGKLRVPITEELLDTEIVVADTDKLLSTYPEVREHDHAALIIFGNGEWGSTSGSLGSENIDWTLRVFALVADPGFQELDVWYYKSLDQIPVPAQSDDEAMKLEDDLESEFEAKVERYLVDNRLPLMRGLQKALEQTLERLQNPQ